MQKAIRCINRQISEDFEPYWGFGGQLRLEGRDGNEPTSGTPIETRGDAIIYLWDAGNDDTALGVNERYY